MFTKDSPLRDEATESGMTTFTFENHNLPETTLCVGLCGHAHTYFMFLCGCKYPCVCGLWRSSKGCCLIIGLHLGFETSLSLNLDGTHCVARLRSFSKLLRIS